MTSNVTLVQGYLDHMGKVLNRSPLTIYKYRNRYASLLAACDKPLATMTVTDLNAWLERPRTTASGEASPATTKHDVAALRSLFTWLHRQGHLSSNVSLLLDSPKVHNEEPKPVPHELWQRVWFADLTDDERVAYGLAHFCGFRRHEVTYLQAHQFTDLPVPMIADVRRKGGGKRGFRWRSCIAIHEQCLPHLIGDPALFIGALLRLRSSRRPEQALLPWSDAPPRWSRRSPLPSNVADPDQFNLHLAKTLARLGLPEDAFTPHQLRHSFGTNLCNPPCSIPIQTVAKLMGHADPKMTMRYVDVGTDPLASYLSAVDSPDDEHLAPIAKHGGIYLE